MKTKHKSGFSLIEVMVATLILAFLAVGGSAALYHTGAMIQNQEQKRMAVDRAMERLELVKRTKYSIMQKEAISLGVSVIYFIDDGDDLLESGDLQIVQDAEDPMGKFPMITAITHVPATTTASEFIQVGVAVTYDNAGQQVMLDTIIVPDL